MKKSLIFLAMFAIFFAINGCVENNPSVASHGLLNTCSESMSEFMPLSSIYCTSDAISAFPGYVLIQNLMTGQVPWSGSGGGSGTQLSVDKPNSGIIFITDIIVECMSIDGDSKACKGATPFETKANQPVNSSGGACANVSIPISRIISEWEYGSVYDLKIRVKYKDDSNMKGEAPATFIQIAFLSKAEALALELKTGCGFYEGGKITQATTEYVQASSTQQEMDNASLIQEAEEIKAEADAIQAHADATNAMAEAINAKLEAEKALEEAQEALEKAKDQMNGDDDDEEDDTDYTEDDE